MASVRELWLILRGRDEASDEVKKVARNVRQAGATMKAAQLQAQAAMIRHRAAVLKASGATAEHVAVLTTHATALDKQAKMFTLAESQARKYSKTIEKKSPNFAKWLFTPNPEMLQRLARPLAAIFSSPVGLAIGASLIAVIVPALATAITGALALGVGAGLIGVGAILLSRNKKWADQAKKHWEKTLFLLGRAAEPLAKPLLNALKSVEKLTRQIEPSLKGLFRDVAPAVDHIVRGFSGFVKQFVSGLKPAMPGIVAAFKGLADALPGLGAALARFFQILFGSPELMERVTSSMVGWVERALKIAGPLIHGLTVLYLAFENAVRLAALGWGQAVAALIDWLSQGSGALQNFVAKWGPLRDAIVNVWNKLKEFAAAKTDAEIIEKFGNLVEAIKQLWGPLKDFLKAAWDLAWESVKRVWNEKVVPWWEGTVKPWLKKQIAEFLREVFQLAVNFAIAELKKLPGRVLAELAKIPGIIASAMARAATEAGRGGQLIVSRVISQLVQLPGRAASAIASLPGQIGGVLDSAARRAFSWGAHIISSLISGINSRLDGLRGAASVAAGIIAGLFPGSPVKFGPLKALNNGRAGRNIVRMIADGMANESGFLRNALQDVMPNPLVPRYGSAYTPDSPGFDSSGSPTPSSGGRAFNQNFYITTQEIDPRKHAADLGWELSGRM